ncbi:uncharacterized protein LOC119159856 isoform X2 [Rhipicephalus microplus]|uniref:uncharacterized protein LOC119159856 isoform X2 n=1 Tax=Rhipicephalus microplus TaxID=6941 RepID=UPI003F6C2A11
MRTCAVCDPPKLSGDRQVVLAAKTSEKARKVRAMVQFYVREYTMTTDGGLNVREVVLCAILWMMYGTFGATTPSEQFLCSCVSIFATYGFFFLMSSIMSVPTALMLPRLFYIVAIACGVLHLAQFIYSLIEN